MRRLVAALCMLAAACSSSATMAPPTTNSTALQSITTTSAAPTGGVITANPARTPGVADPQVTQDNIGSTICKSGYTATVRPPSSYTNRLKVQQLAADPRYVDRNPTDYEEDHAISLELGGHPTDAANLWPEPQPRSFATDADENRLHKAVCNQSMMLADAQREIMRIKQTMG